jgi:hypothetical protein
MGIDEESGDGYVSTDRINHKNVSWKSNGDGTYYLVGTDPV